MLITAGVDVGSTASKAVVLGDGRVLGSIIGPSTSNPARTAEEIFKQAIAQAGIAAKKVNSVLGTGYGRAQVPFAGQNVSEISCHARGANFLNPAIRTVIDIGGQDTKAVSVDPSGAIMDFVMNEKCAAGTGRFLEAMARSLGLELAEMSRMNTAAGEACTISSMCSVFAESEVINLVNEGLPLERIVKGIYMSLASRVASLAHRVGLADDVALTGGVAKSRGVVETLQEKLKTELVTLDNGFDPQLVGALGAAVLAADYMEEG